MLLAALLLAQAACPAVDANLPAPYAGWTSFGAATDVGKAVMLDSRDDPALVASIPGAKPGRVATLDFYVPKPDIYSIALDQKGWIDVAPAAGNTMLKSVSHLDGDPCWSIKKIVRFQLEAGAYRLAITGLTAPRVKAMLVAGE